MNKPMNYFIILTIDKVPEMKDIFLEWRNELGAENAPWSIHVSNIYRVNILNRAEAIEKKFIDSNGNRRFWVFPGEGTIFHSIFGFETEDEALNFGASLENSFMGII